MTYDVRLLPRAAKQLGSLPVRARAQVIERVRCLADWPDHGQDVAPLRGRHAGLYRLRCGDYRVLFAVVDATREIVIEQVARRQRAYR